jgi:hypothetical protein
MRLASATSWAATLARMTCGIWNPTSVMKKLSVEHAWLGCGRAVARTWPAQ